MMAQAERQRAEMPPAYQIAAEDPSLPDIAALIALHLEQMQGYSPPETCHALDAELLAGEDTALFAARREGALAAIGALKQLGPRQCEIKSMRAHPDFLGKGAGEAMLIHLIDQAKARGAQWIGLETGRDGPFEPAIRLYQKYGFVECEPYAEYTKNHFSICMERCL